MSEHQGVTAYQAWVALLNKLLYAHEVGPRGLMTKEGIAEQVFIEDAYQNIVADPQRKLNYRFMVAQWLTTLLGLEDRPLLDQFNKHLAGYDDDGQGGRYPSYGPRLMPQWPYILQTLTRDPASRQAVLSIWEAQRPSVDPDYVEGRPADTPQRYVPCTLSLQFLLRGGRLHTLATMRSSDAWLGLPYDIFNFTMLANHLVGALNHVTRSSHKLGSITLNLGSSHLYERDWETARSIVNAPVGRAIASPQLPLGISLPNNIFDPFVTFEAYHWPREWNKYLMYRNAIFSTANAEALGWLMALEKEHATI